MRKEFLEHYYTTSLYKGDIGTLDNSLELTKEEVFELEKRVGYKQPNLLSRTPSQQEIDALFPTNISFFKLESSGKFVFLHSKYLGKDNCTNDRFGNYFSHSLILKEGQPNFKAISLFSQEKEFVKEFSLETDRSYQHKLDVKPLYINQENNEGYFHSLCEFITQSKNRLSLFSKIIDTIVDGLIYQKKIITICDTNENLQKWMFATNYFLPNNLSNLLPFASYVADPTKASVKLTGITKDCGINSLDPNLFTFLDAGNDFTHIVSNDFTKYLIEIVTENSDQSYLRLKALNEKIQSYGITELNSRLNLPAAIQYFKKDIQSKTIEDFSKLLALKLPQVEELELKNHVLEYRPDIYLGFVIAEMKKAISSSCVFKEKTEAYSKIYTAHFENNITLRRNFLSDFVEAFRDELSSNEKNAASVYVLTNSNCLDVQPPSWLAKKIQDAELWFENEMIDIENKIESIKSLNTRYNLQEFQDLIPNIMKVRTIDEISKAASNGNLFKSLDKHKNKIKELSSSDKRMIFIVALNNENIKNQFELSFGKYIRVIKEYFPETESEFWYHFFESNKNWNPNNDFKKHSLDYLKKKFVVSNFTSELHRPELFEKIRLNSYEMQWIEEEIRETAKKNSMVEEFYAVFENSMQAKNSGWFSNINPFKKKVQLDISQPENSEVDIHQDYPSGNFGKIKVILNGKLEEIKRAKETGNDKLNISLNFIFKGGSNHERESAGIAISQFYFKEKLLSKGGFCSASRNDLVGSYIGETEQRTRNICENTKGNVLFIENAEDLFKDSHDSFGREAFLILLKEIENNKSDFCIVFSGYSTEMEKLINLNSTLKNSLSNILSFN